MLTGVHGEPGFGLLGWRVESAPLQLRGSQKGFFAMLLGRSRLSPGFRVVFPTLEVERVEQAFRPAARAGRMPALAAEVLLVDSLQRPNHRIYLLCHRQCPR